MSSSIDHPSEQPNKKMKLDHEHNPQSNNKSNTQSVSESAMSTNLQPSVNNQTVSITSQHNDQTDSTISSKSSAIIQHNSNQTVNQTTKQPKKKFQYERPANEPHIPSRFLHLNLSTDLVVQPDGSVNIAINLSKTSKSARKAVRREQRFEQAKAQRTVKRAEYKQRQKVRKQQNQALGLYNHLLPHQRAKGSKQRAMVREMTNQTMKVLIDLSDEKLMTDEESYSLAKQLRFLYIDNNHTEHPVRIVLSNMPMVTPAIESTQSTTQSIDQSSTQSNQSNNQSTNQPDTQSISSELVLNDSPAMRVYDQLNKQQGVKDWAWDWITRHYLRSFDQSQLVYLTAESDQLITELDEKTVYVIGGLVDHNRLKNHCETTAKQLGLRTARLPIGECMQSAVGHRSVITVNQVFACLITARSFQLKAGDQPWDQRWAAALQKVLPERQGWIMKEELAQAIAENPAIQQLTAQPTAQSNSQSNNQSNNQSINQSVDMDNADDGSDQDDQSMSGDDEQNEMES